jgi:hypothetical protein
MTPLNYSSNRLSRNEARKLVNLILAKHPDRIWFSKHALNELYKDGLDTVDAFNLLKSPDSRIYDEGELCNGTYRYRLETNNLVIVITFSEDGKNIMIVTAWDKRKK